MSGCDPSLAHMIMTLAEGSLPAFIGPSGLSGRLQGTTILMTSSVSASLSWLQVVPSKLTHQGYKASNTPADPRRYWTGLHSYRLSKAPG